MNTTSLPPLHPPGASENPKHFPFKQSVTKVEKYRDLVRFDRCTLKRREAHFRNALKTTSGLEAVARDFDRGIRKLEEEGSKPVLFDRLAVCREAFEKIAELNQDCAPELKHIMDVYNEYVLHKMSKRMVRRQSYSLQVAVQPRDKDADEIKDEDFDQLKHRLHQLEVKVRVSLQDHDKLAENFKRATMQHQQEVQDLHLEGQMKVDEVTDMVAEKEHSNEYLAHLERLHMQIAEKHRKIREEKSKRKGNIPMSVYHNLEQCLREVEIDTQKAHRKNLLLHNKIKEREQILYRTLRSNRLDITGDLKKILGFS